MVARIVTPNSIVRALNYNEQKVQRKDAEILFAGNFLKDADKMNFHEKLEGFNELIRRNERAKTNSLHISLNFDNADILDREKLVQIGMEYMDKIGFGNQPYLVYQHHDSGHPHIHIVTTNIQPDGRRIDTHHIGRNQSERARKEIEQSYGLIKAEGRRQAEKYELKPVNAKKVQYGKLATKQAITNVLLATLDVYKYTSLPELNAILQQYNVAADRGTETSRIFKNKGLVYRVLDDNGNKVGVPIKASDLYSKPVLRKLETKFSQKETEREPYKRRTKNVISQVLLINSPRSVREFAQALEQRGIKIVLRQNAAGFIYGITYVDLNTKCVFNGSTLGKEFSAKAIVDRCEKGIVAQRETGTDQHQVKDNVPENTATNPGEQQGGQQQPTLLEILMQPGRKNDYLDPNFKRTKKKQKRNSHRL